VVVGGSLQDKLVIPFPFMTWVLMTIPMFQTIDVLSTSPG